MSRLRTTRWGIATLPLLLFSVAFFIGPQVYFLRSAFFRTNSLGELTGGVTAATLAHATQGYYLHALVRTVELCLLTSAFGVVLAYPLAYAAVRSRRWGGFVFVAVVASMFSSAVARVLGWQVLLSPSGPINHALMSTGITDSPVPLINNFTGVVIGTVHAVLPIAVIGLMPVCEMVHGEELLAAESLGATPLRTFLTIFLPQTRTGIIGVSLLVFAVSAAAFTTPALLGGGRVAVLSILIYTLSTQTLDYSTAAALALVMLGLVALAVLLGLALGRKGPRPPAANI